MYQALTSNAPNPSISTELNAIGLSTNPQGSKYCVAQTTLSMVKVF
jgi:hypothetical protein